MSTASTGQILRLNRTVGVQVLDGQLFGVADQYKVRFDADGFEFTPVLGGAAPRNYPMTYRLESVRRGETSSPLRPCTATHAGLRVEYDRGAAIERCDVGDGAMEQSFVFEKRPAGTGDLILRGRLQTDLVVSSEQGGLRLEAPGIGGFHIGSVIGVDADGRRVEGQVRYDSGILEYTLPAAFVDGAALPFVLDPPLGGLFIVSSNAANERAPLAAYDVSTDSFLVVWQTVVSSIDTDIHGQRVSRAGALIGARIPISVFPDNDREPELANHRGMGAFIVVFTRASTNSGDIIGKSVSAATGGVVVGTTIAGGAAAQDHPAIGGDSVNAVGSAGVVCAWHDASAAALLAMRVTIQTDLTLTVGTVRTIAQGAEVLASRPRISKGGGGTRRHAVVYERSTAPWAVVVDSSATPITAAVPLDPISSQALAVDGDGSNWVVAWQDDNSIPGARLIRGCTISHVSGPGLLVATAPRTIDTGSGDHRSPAVIRTGGSTLVGWSRQLSNAFDGMAGSVDTFGCTACENPFVLGGANPVNGAVSGCSTASGGGSPDDALLVWESATSGTFSSGDILARLWRSADGAVTSLGGGCGTGGSAQATCARVPNPDFAHRLRGATPNAGTFLLQSLGQETGSCGSCTRIPALAGAVTMFALTDGVGNATIGSRIPNNVALRGLTQFDQWLTLRPAGACSQFNLDMSNALRIVIE